MTTLKVENKYVLNVSFEHVPTHGNIYTFVHNLIMESFRRTFLRIYDKYKVLFLKNIK